MENKNHVLKISLKSFNFYNYVFLNDSNFIYVIKYI